MKNPIMVSGNVSHQMINIKKTSLDSELKASVTIEFMVTDDESMLNFMRLARLQGDAASFSASPAQPDMFEKAISDSPKVGENGNGEREPVFA